MPKKIKNFSIIVWVLYLLAPVASAYAQGATENGQGQNGAVQKAVVCPAGEAHPAGDTQTCKPVVQAVDCASGRVSQTDPTKCAPLGNDCKGVSANTCLTQSPIVKNINNIVNFLAAGVGVVVIAVIIIGGIQYSMAGDNPSALSEARKRIINGLIALVAFLLLFTFVEWLIPGGV